MNIKSVFLSFPFLAFKCFLDCLCDSFIDVDGHGICRKEHRNKIGCYVKKPSYCADTITNDDNGRLYSLSQACELKGIYQYYKKINN